MKRKFLALLIALVCMIVNVGAGVFAEDAQLSDEQLKAYSFTAALKIYTPEACEPQKQITRGEMVKVLGKILNLNISDNYDISKFFDDVDDPEISALIDNLSSMGIVSGTQHRIYEPEALVKTEQLATCLVTMLGYKEYAAATGGYPQGYMSGAKDLDILKYSNALLGEELTEADFVMMISNALKADAARLTLEGAGFIIESDDGMTILQKRHDIYMDEGVVSDDGITSITGESKIGMDQAQINDAVYYRGDANPSEYIGQKVKFYYHEDNKDAGTLLYMEPSNKKQTVMTVTAECIDSADKFSVEYFPNNDPYQSRTKRLKISPVATVIYNGHSYLDYTAEDLIINSGNITFIDEDGDNEYDILYIREYTSVVFDSYLSDAETTSIRDVYSSERDIEFDTEKTVLKILREGEYVELNSLVKWDVLNVLLPKNMQDCERSVIDIIVTVEPVGGAIDSVDDDEVVVSGITYEISKSYLDAVKYEYAPELSTGKAGILLLDIDGRVGGFREISQYDYIYATRLKIDDTTEPVTAILRGYMWNKGFVELKLNKKITLDGEKGDVPKIFNSNDTLIANANPESYSYSVKPQLVRIQQNMNEEIKSIETAVDLSSTKVTLEEKMRAETSNTFRKSTDSDTLLAEGKLEESRQKLYYRGAGSFDGKVYPVSSTRVIVVPKDDVTLEKIFESRGGNSFTYDADYNIMTYNESLYNVPEYIIVNKAGSSGGDGDDDTFKKSSFYIHDQFSEVLNEDDMVENVMMGLQSGENVQKRITEDFETTGGSGTYDPQAEGVVISPDKLEFGSVVQIGEDTEGKANFMKLWYTPSMGKYKSKTSDKYRQNWRSIISGEVKKVSSDVNYIIVDDEQNAYTYDLSSAVVTICDMGIYKDIYPGDKTEIRVGDQVTMRIRETRVHEIIVFKNLK